MTYVAFALFFIAFIGSLLSLYAGIVQNMPKLLAVMNGRGRSQRPMRRIIALPLRHAVQSAVPSTDYFHPPMPRIKLALFPAPVPAPAYARHSCGYALHAAHNSAHHHSANHMASPRLMAFIASPAGHRQPRCEMAPVAAR